MYHPPRTFPKNTKWLDMIAAERTFPFSLFSNLRAPSRAQRTIAALKSRQGGACGLPADDGWVYLINDTNDFLSWQFGAREWSDQERERLDEIMGARRAWFEARNIPYLMTVTPEKSVAYREYLPAPLLELVESAGRPAAHMKRQFGDMVLYPDNYLDRLKKQGLLYFRVDTHTNWLGAYHIYRHAIERLGCIGKPVPMSHMKIDIASWLGDVLIQVPEALKRDFESDADEWRPAVLQESLIQFNLHPDHQHTRRLAEPDVFRVGRPERETIVTLNEDKTLPRAVIFRDSTASFMIDWLAEHFSRAVFVWHRDDVIGDVIGQERPDVVLHFKAERFLSTYPVTLPVTFGVQPQQ